MIAAQGQKGTIMVVDDQPANLKLLEDMLGNQGYRVRSFPRGRLALSAASLKAPDLILLDINMPEMNGYEVCERLKADEGLREVPVIFLSALNETSDKVRAFQTGAVDYITKPFQFDEVRARVDTHSQLHQLQQSLRQHNDHLEELVGSRTRELAEANGRLTILDRAKTDFLNLISHEFRTPLNGLLGVGDLMLDEFNPDAELRQLFDQSRRRILAIIEDAEVLSQIEVGKEKFACERLNLGSILVRAVEHSSAFAEGRQVTLPCAPAEAVWILAAEDLLVKALKSLFETAVRFSKPGGSMQLSCRSVGEAVQLEIESSGRSIPAPVIPRFFDVLAIGEAITPDGDFGLGPAVAHRILSLFGGTVTVENRDPAGIRLTVTLKGALPE
jgi:two-component system sensor histidine kinase/response regulator